MNTAQKIYEVGKALPEQALAELLDFAEFLSQKQTRKDTATPAAPLLELQGGLERSATFAGDPVQIQEQLRDEWR